MYPENRQDLRSSLNIVSLYMEPADYKTSCWVIVLHWIPIDMDQGLVDRVPMENGAQFLFHPVIHWGFVASIASPA